MVVVLELLGGNPLLVVEGEHDAHRGLLYQFEGVLVDLCAVEEPGQRGHDALQTLQLSVPCRVSFSFVGAVTGVGAVNDELDPFDGGVVESRAHDLQMINGLKVTLTTVPPSEGPMEGSILSMWML